MSAMRVLCLHGFMQSAAIFKAKTGALRSALKHVEFVYIDAPFRVERIPPRIFEMMQAAKAARQAANQGTTEDNAAEPMSDEVKELQYTWWHTNDDASQYYEWQKSIDVVKAAIKEQGPFDGVLGFSQGAAMASLLCALQQQSDADFRFRFAVMFGGFTPRSTDLVELYAPTAPLITIPTLHVYGETDAMVVPERSRTLFEKFTNAEVIVHPGGHLIPLQADLKRQYIAFLDRFR